MTIAFKKLAGPTWTAEVGGVTIFIDDQNGQPDPAQHAIALRIAANFPGTCAKATSYLDLFVDRSKACGSDNEEWELIEIELRGMQNHRPRCSFCFALNGDTDGYWTVDLTAWPDEFNPVRFERNQG